MRTPRRNPRREADRERPKPGQPVCWPMLHMTSPEFLAAYTAYVDSVAYTHSISALDYPPMSAGQWYAAMLAEFVR